jgi:hypothetical protein
MGFSITDAAKSVTRPVVDAAKKLPGAEQVANAAENVSDTVRNAADPFTSQAARTVANGIENAVRSGIDALLPGGENTPDERLYAGGRPCPRGGRCRPTRGLATNDESPGSDGPVMA